MPLPRQDYLVMIDIILTITAFIAVVIFFAWSPKQKSKWRITKKNSGSTVSLGQ